MLKAQEAQEFHKISKAKTKLEALKKTIRLDEMHHKLLIFFKLIKDTNTYSLRMLSVRKSFNNLKLINKASNLSISTMKSAQSNQNLDHKCYPRDMKI